MTTIIGNTGTGDIAGNKRNLGENYNTFYIIYINKEYIED